MRDIDKDKIQVRYVTCINRCLPGYPTPLDILYDSCMENIETDGFSSLAKIQNRYFTDDEDGEMKVRKVIDILLDLGYISRTDEQNVERYKIIKTPWD